MISENELIKRENKIESQKSNESFEDSDLQEAKFEYDNIVVLRAGEENILEIKENWPYKDFSFDDWKEKGSLITSEGLPSRLSEHQYKQVRTIRFKSFFGDWQSDPENSSKIINKVTGEPLVLYRGDGTKYRDEYVVKGDDVRDMETKNDQGIFFTNSENVAKGYAEDISGHLGVYGKDYYADHPETFEETKKYVLSVINSDKSFWYKVFVSHLPNSDQYRGDMNSTDSNIAFKTERIFRSELSMVLKKDLVDSIVESVKTHGLRNSVDVNAVLDAYVEKGRFEELFGFVKTYQHGGNENIGNQRILNRMHLDAIDINSDINRSFKMEPRIVKQVFINARSVHFIQSNTSQSGPEIARVRKEGFDVAIGRGAVGGGLADEYIVFDSQNIKSATDNDGLFNPDSKGLNN